MKSITKKMVALFGCLAGGLISVSSFSAAQKCAFGSLPVNVSVEYPTAEWCIKVYSFEAD